MNYPLISEYIESIRYAKDNFATLTHLRPMLDEDGNPIMSSGNFAVVFKMRSERDNKFYALKCFIKDQPGRDESYRLINEELEYVSSHFIVPIKYLDKELFVDSASCDNTEFPVLLMDWVEGVTLDKWVRQHLNDQYSLKLITYQFCRMASWLMSQPFAHGDLKPDNILVRDDGSLVMVDYDGMYVPSMQGQQARELGSPDYRHPARTAADFNEHIDDFSLAAIAMQLCAIAFAPSLLGTQQGDTLLLAESDYRDLVSSTMLSRLNDLLNYQEFERLYALFHFAYADTTLSGISFRAFHFPKPIKKTEVKLSTKVTDDDLKNGVSDEFGALYSPDGLRLLKGPNIQQYHIRQGTKVICNQAFENSRSLSVITLPSSVEIIGFRAFRNCAHLKGVNIPSSVKTINSYAFEKCRSLTSIQINDLVNVIEYRVFAGCKSLKEIKLDNGITEICSEAFANCLSLKIIDIPDTVNSIGFHAFYGCENLQELILPSSINLDGKLLDGMPNSIIKSIVNRQHEQLVHIDEFGVVYSRDKKVLLHFPYKFDQCKYCILETCEVISISAAGYEISDEGYLYTDNLITELIVPETLREIQDEALAGCGELTNIKLPNGLKKIGKQAFRFCKMSSLFIPDGIEFIGENAFPNSLKVVKGGLRHFVVSSSFLMTKDGLLLWTNPDITSFEFPYGVKRIGAYAFTRRQRLKILRIPDGVQAIGEYAFWQCKKLVSVYLPDSIKEIGKEAFVNDMGCDKYYWPYTSVNIYVPTGKRDFYKSLLKNVPIEKIIEYHDS